jgi:hypothetical protein
LQMRDELIATRKLVADTINHHLAMNGHAIRVDHRAHRERGIRRAAERYLGPAKIRGMSPKEKAAYVAVRKN